MNRRQFVLTGSALAAMQGLPALALAPGCALAPRIGVAQFDSYDPLAEIDLLGRDGFDYVEPAVVKVMARSDAEFAAALAKSRSARIHVEAMNSLLPADLKVVGPAIDQPRLRDYLQQALGRAQQMGAKVVVFGSGDARMVPDGFARERAMEQLVEFLHQVGDEIVRNHYGMVVGIEALRKAECNIINRSAEAYDLALRANHPKVRIIVDFFHLVSEGEDPGIVRVAKDYIVHIHFSDPTLGREFPRRASIHPMYQPFFAALRDIGYKGRISLEALTTNFAEDAREGVLAVRQFCATACAGVKASSAARA